MTFDDVIIRSGVQLAIILYTISMATVGKLSSYAEGLGCEAKKRYLEKLQVIAGQDPFLLASNRVGGAVTRAKDLPQVEASDIVSYLVLQTSFLTAKQFKAHKSLEAYNQFVSGWVKEVFAWSINGKVVVTGRVSMMTIHTNSLLFTLLLFCIGEAFSTL